MRLIQLEVENFGIFARRQFQFGDGHLSLVYGANETGKSTLLQLIREMLFGFPHRDTIAVGNGSITARATMQLEDGRLLAWHRRKGRVNKLTGHLLPQGSICEPDQLEALLCGATAELYQHVFAFSLRELQEGEKSLRAAKLTEALYGGGAGGLAAFRQIESAIEERLAKLFSPRGSRPRINEQLQRIRDTSRQLKDAAVKPSAFEDLSRQYEAAEQLCREHAERVESLSNDLSRLEALLQMQPAMRRRQYLQQQLDQLQLPTTIPLASLPQLADAAEKRLAAEQELQKLSALVEERQRRRNQIIVADTISDWDTKILQLYADLQRIAACRRDQPLRRQDADAIEQDIDHQLSRWKPDWNREFLRHFALGRAELKSIREMAEQRNRFERQESEIEGARRAHLQQIQDGEQSLEHLTIAKNPDELLTLIEQAPRIELLLEQRQKLACECQQLRNQLELQRRSLEQFTGQRLTSSIASLEMPSRKTVEQFRQQWEDAERSITVARHELANLSATIQQCRDTIQQLDSAGTPTRLQLEEARAARHQSWLEFVAFVQRAAANDEQIAARAQAHEKLVAACDALTDRLLAADAAVAEYEACSCRLRTLEEQFTSAETKLAQLAAANQQLREQWRQLWSIVGLEPLAPNAMMDWLREIETARDVEMRLATLDQHDQALAQQCNFFLEQLARLVAERDLEPLALIKSARQIVLAAQQAQTQRRHLVDALNSSRRELEKLEHQLKHVQSQQLAWRENWEQRLASWRLPTEWTPQVAEEVLGKLFELKERLKTADGFRLRVDDMQRDIDAFTAATQDVCRAVAADLLGAEPDDAVRELFQRAEQSRSNARLRAELDSEILRLEQQLQEARETHANLSNELDCLPDFAQANMLPWAPKLRAASDIIVELTSIEQLFTRIETTSALPQLGDGNEKIEHQCAALRSQLSEAKTAHQQALRSAALLAQQLEELDSQSRTSELALELEKHRAELQSAVDQWAPLAMASALMKGCLEQFERDRQPRLLQIAGELFQQMTGGRYLEIRRRLGEEESLVVRQHDDTEKEPAQLSTGTREQLYLAIRLAYVMHYCDKAEPLPIVMDDVLVNFDAQRAARTLEVLANVSQSAQILLMTCHEATARMVMQAMPQITRVDLGEPLAETETRLVPQPRRKRTRLAPAAARDRQQPLFQPHGDEQ